MTVSLLCRIMTQTQSELAVKTTSFPGKIQYHSFSSETDSSRKGDDDDNSNEPKLLKHPTKIATMCNHKFKCSRCQRTKNTKQQMTKWITAECLLTITHQQSSQKSLSSRMSLIQNSSQLSSSFPVQLMPLT